MLNKSLHTLKENTSLYKKLSNPIAKLDGSENFEEATGKIGAERLVGFMQAYKVMREYFIRRETNFNSNEVSAERIDTILRIIYEKICDVK